MKLSEFSKLTGIKRTALQFYAKEGLLEPIEESKQGYWEYSEDELYKARISII